ncbi:MAG: HlyD family efflux transporter periplasmic adaptor subunit [Mucilaginibacter sp.]|nr:HlyD family efflux transporter periplasmic adaptor subunit [Mucilaginibacter sp.]
MPDNYIYNGQEVRHTDDMQDIITKVPSWILRWGITLFFCLLLLIIGLSAFIRYPDIVNASLTIDSPNSPKPVVAKISGKLVKLLVKENETVKTGQPLAYLESTADHREVIDLLASLKQLQNLGDKNKPIPNTFFNQEGNTQLGELQASYQTFFQEYLTYRASVQNGFYVQKRAYLKKDLADQTKQEDQLRAQKKIQQQDLGLAKDEYKMHQKLALERVETSAELRQQESKYLAKKSPLVQTDALLVTANTNYSAKQKEILELDNQIAEEKAKFLQALNSLISQAEDWTSKYVLTAAQSGKIAFAGIVQENQVLTPGKEVFYINPGNEQFFGEMSIPQFNLGKVKMGQEVLIKLKSYPFEEFGMIKGRIKYISDIPYKDSIFISRVDFKGGKLSDMKRPIHLKQGMMADAEIVTQDATILQRIGRNILKVINKK